MIMTSPTTSPGRECSRGDKVGDRSCPDGSSSPDNSVRPSSSSSFPGVRLPVRSVETDEEEDPSKSLLQSDFINAFNQTNRDAAFQEVEKIFPECLSWVLSSYSSSSLLQFADTTILSNTGFHQGDP